MGSPIRDCGNNPLKYVDPTGHKAQKPQKQQEAPKKGKYEKQPNPNQRRGAENRQPSGERQRNVGHNNGEEHSRTPKGQQSQNPSQKRAVETPKSKQPGAPGIAPGNGQKQAPAPAPQEGVSVSGVLVGAGIFVAGAVATAVLVADDATGIGVADDPFLVVTVGMMARGGAMVCGKL